MAATTALGSARGRLRAQGDIRCGIPPTDVVPATCLLYTGHPRRSRIPQDHGTPADDLGMSTVDDRHTRAERRTSPRFDPPEEPPPSPTGIAYAVLLATLEPRASRPLHGPGF